MENNIDKKKSRGLPENEVNKVPDEEKEFLLDDNNKMSEELVGATSNLAIKKKRRKRNKKLDINVQANLTKQYLDDNQLVPINNLDLVPITINEKTENSKLIQHKEYNVLLMGQTGVGKSTFINALANYVKFEDFKTAKRSNLDVLIPCQFSVWDDKFEEQTIRFGSDCNENLDEAGHSSTQRCKEHYIVYDDALIRIFDTPGVGDTRGIDQDKLNLEEILGTLSDYEDLHCICILLKPNESRLTATFEFCIKQLLCHLQKNAVNNIVFVFTNCRGTFYKPGDTVRPLMAIFDKIKNTSPSVAIPFNKNNVFCLDNESFRFLLASKQGIEVNLKQEEDFSQSWRTSVDESKRLMQFIINEKSGIGMSPHKIKETLSVNQARRIIVDLSRPLAELAQNIQDNLAVLNQHMQVIENCNDDVVKLRENMYLPQVTLDIIPINQPRTVCQANCCAKPYKVGNLIKCHYPQKCHDPCYLLDVPKEIVGHEKLRHCQAMDTESECCNVCGCPYSTHLHIYYDSRPTEKRIIDEDIKKQIKDKTTALVASTKQVNKLQWQVSMYKKEGKKLTNYTAKLAVFLKQNAIIAYNDAFQDYLNQLIDNEKSLSKHGSNNQQVIKGLEEMISNYLQEQNILETTLNQHNNAGNIKAEEVFDIIAELQQMQLTGGTLQLTMKACNSVSKPRQQIKTENGSNILMKAINWGLEKFADKNKNGGNNKVLALPST